MRISANASWIERDFDFGGLLRSFGRRMILDALQVLLASFCKTGLLGSELLTKNLELGQIFVGLAPETLSDGELLIGQRRVVLVFGGEAKRVISAGVARVELDHVPRDEFGEPPFLHIASANGDGLELNEGLAASIGT